LAICAPKNYQIWWKFDKVLTKTSWDIFWTTLCISLSGSVCGLGMDELSRWWSAVLAVAAHWLCISNDDESSLVAAQRFYAVIDSLPSAVQNAE